MSLPTSFETRVAPGVRVAFAAERVLYQVKSAAHEKLVIQNPQFGRMMMIDGIVQLNSADQFIHQEMLSHVPLLTHGRVERVLILGGGGSALAEEVLKHGGVRRVLQVESDPHVVRITRTYFDGANVTADRDARFQIRIADAAKFVSATNERFDVILLDIRKPRGARGPMFGDSFYRSARGCLRSGGLLVAQLGVPFLQQASFAASIGRLAALFPIVSCYLVPVPSVFGGPLALGWASSTLSPHSIGADELATRFAAANIGTRYYTPEIHRAAFVLPRYVQEAVDTATRPEQLVELRTG
jgi:spermidine synthase